MKRMRKKFLSVLLMLGMVCSLLPAGSMTAKAAVNVAFKSFAVDGKEVAVWYKDADATQAVGTLEAVEENKDRIMYLKVDPSYDYKGVTQNGGSMSATSESSKAASDGWIIHTINMHFVSAMADDPIVPVVDLVDYNVTLVKHSDSVVNIDKVKALPADKQKAPRAKTYEVTLEAEAGYVVTGGSYVIGSETKSFDGPSVSVPSSAVTGDIAIHVKVAEAYDLQIAPLTGVTGTSVTVNGKTETVSTTADTNTVLADVIAAGSAFSFTVNPPSGYALDSVDAVHADSSVTGTIAKSVNGNTVTLNDVKGDVKVTLSLKNTSVKQYDVKIDINKNLREAPASDSSTLYKALTTADAVILTTATDTARAAEGEAFSFVIKEGDNDTATNRRIRYTMEGTNGTLTASITGTGQYKTAKVTGNITLLEVGEEGATVNATYPKQDDADNKVYVRNANGNPLSATAVTTSVGDAFDFTVTPRVTADGIRFNPQIKVTVNGDPVTAEIVQKSIDQITYRIPEGRTGGDIVIDKFTDVAAKRTIKFDPVQHVTFASRDDDSKDMQPFAGGVLTFVYGDDAALQLSVDAGYQLKDLKLTDEYGNPVPNATYNATDKKLVIPGASVRDGMTIKKVETIVSDTPAQTLFADDTLINSVHKADVYRMNELGIVKGVGNNTFNPKGGATRAEFSTMIYRTCVPKSNKVLSRFPDVRAPLHADLIEGVIALEDLNPAIVEGYEGGTFQPNRVVTRGEAILMVWRAAGKPAPTATNAFTDVAAWYRDAANWGAQTGIVQGYTDGLYHGADSLTREQLCSILNRAIRANALQLKSK